MTFWMTRSTNRLNRPSSPSRRMRLMPARMRGEAKADHATPHRTRTDGANLVDSSHPVNMRLLSTAQPGSPSSFEPGMVWPRALAGRRIARCQGEGFLEWNVVSSGLVTAGARSFWLRD